MVNNTNKYMVESLDRLSHLFTTKTGLAEAILLPYLAIIDLAKVASLNKRCHSIFDPRSKHHINVAKTFFDRLNACVDNETQEVLLVELQGAETWLKVL